MADESLAIGKDPANLEDLTVVWLDEHSQDFCTRTRLRCIINFLKVFTQIDSCLDYIRSVPNEHLFIIVSGELSSSVIPLIHDLSQVRHCYIFCENREKYLSNISSGVFCDQETLYKQLSKDVNHFYATHSTTITFLSEKSLRDLTRETGAFFWFRLFTTALLRMPPSNGAKRDLLQLARELYADNELELKRIEEFDRTYQPFTALTWYSSDSFIYRLLNKAIRTENIDLLFACRFFIADLHQQLDSLHTSYRELLRSYELETFTVYHGQHMTKNDFVKLQANIGKLISVNSFLSTSIDRQVALIYAGDGSTRPAMISVLFEITVDLSTSPNSSQHPFADISIFSHFKEEKEVLFSLAAIFRIESIVQEPDDIWLVKLVLIDSTEETKEMYELSKYLGIHPNKTTTMADLAHLLFQMSEYYRAITFCQKILLEMPTDLPLAIRCFNIMGQSYRNNPELSLQSFENALEIQLQHNPNDWKSLATIYNNIGFAHRRLRSDKQVIVHYYEKAYQMCTSLPDVNDIDWCLVATFLNNLVTVDPTGDSNLALEREQLVLDIRLKFLPISHPLVATTQMTLAEIHSSRGEFDEALKLYDEALRIKFKYLPSEDPSIANVYSSKALLYLNKGDYEMTIDQQAASQTSYITSLKLNDRALDILLSRESSSSIDYELLSLVINNCGVVYTRLNRFDEALECFSIFMNVISQHLSENDYTHGATLKNRGRIYMLQGDMNKAMEFYTLALAFFKRIDVSNSPVVAQIYFYIGEWYELSHQIDRAVEYYERAVQLGIEVFRKGHPTLIHYTNTLACFKERSLSMKPIEEVSRL